MRSVAELLAAHPSQQGAIGAPGRPDMTRAQLHQAVAMVGDALRGQGIRQQDSVAMVMPVTEIFTWVWLLIHSTKMKIG